VTEPPAEPGVDLLIVAAALSVALHNLADTVDRLAATLEPKEKP
jgi:hypothetical protein